MKSFHPELPPGAGYEHWRSMAADTVNSFWFTNRESGVLLAEVDRLRGRFAELLDEYNELKARMEGLEK